MLINGSPHRDGNTHCALAEVAKALENEGVETVEEWIGTQAVQGCIGCSWGGASSMTVFMSVC